MIKTTSFALSRPSQAAPRSNSPARQRAIKAARTRATAQTQPNLGALFAAPTPVPEISAAQAREIIQGASAQSKTNARPKTKPTPITTAPVAPRSVPKAETIMPSTSPAPKKTPRTTKTKEHLPTTPVAPLIVASKIEEAPAEVVAAVVEKTAPKKATEGAKKSRRPRVPVNLAEQYGQSLSKRVENGIEVVEEDAPKKRLNRAERQARRELMNPDDDLMARLHRVHNAIPTTKPEKRQRGWRFDCGRCGQTSFFQTNGALCKCGALAIKE